MTCRLPEDERQMLAFILVTSGEGDLETLVVPELADRIRLRFEWFFLSDGTPRRRAS